MRNEKVLLTTELSAYAHRHHAKIKLVVAIGALLDLIEPDNVQVTKGQLALIISSLEDSTIGLGAVEVNHQGIIQTIALIADFVTISKHSTKNVSYHVHV